MRLPQPVRVAGTGHSLPAKIVTNADLSRSGGGGHGPGAATLAAGFTKRHRCGRDEASSNLGAAAAAAAMAAAGIGIEDVDLIVTSSITPDLGFPSTACLIQGQLGAKEFFPAFDVVAGVGGFAAALVSAAGFVAAGASKAALAVAAECSSRFERPSDPERGGFLGDGAAAVVVVPGEGAGQVERIGLCGGPSAPGAAGPLLELPGGYSAHPASRQTLEEGLHFFQFARDFEERLARACAGCGGRALSDEGATLLVPPQAGEAFFLRLASLLGVPETLILRDCADTAFTLSASQPLALDRALRAGRVHPGSSVLIFGADGPHTGGYVLLRW